jgi:AcrR family transcriptional regulator
MPWEAKSEMVVNPIPSRRSSEDWSPNQLAKREAIIQATARLMLHEGVRACTSRAISATSELSTSAVHYYFRDTDEIVDLAFRRIGERFFHRVEEIARGEPKAVDALWAAASEYLVRGSEWHEQHGKQVRGHNAPMLWFEFHAESLRKGDLTTARELSAWGLTIFEKLLKAAGVTAVASTAQTLYSTLLGATIRDSLFHRPTYEVLAEIANTLHLPVSSKYCRAPRNSRPKAA